MVYVFAFLWVLIWGLVGYFSVRAIQVHIEKKRAEDAMACYAIQKMILERRLGKVNGRTEVVYNPFAGILRGEEL